MKSKSNNKIKILIIFGILFLSTIGQLTYDQVKCTTVTSTTTFTGTLLNYWDSDKYEELDITLWVTWTYNYDTGIFTYQQWSFTIEFDLGDKSKKESYNDYIRLKLADAVTVFSDNSVTYKDGDSITRTSNYGPIPGAVSDTLEINLFIRSYVKPGFWYSYKRCEYCVYWDSPMGKWASYDVWY